MQYSHLVEDLFLFLVELVKSSIGSHHRLGEVGGETLGYLLRFADTGALDEHIVIFASFGHLRQLDNEVATERATNTTVLHSDHLLRLSPFLLAICYDDTLVHVDSGHVVDDHRDLQPMIFRVEDVAEKCRFAAALLESDGLAVTRLKLGTYQKP
jgi:hypothetical protein